MVYEDDKDYWGDKPESFGDEDSDDMMKLIYATMDNPLPPSPRDNFTETEKYIYYEMRDRIHQLERQISDLQKRLLLIETLGVEGAKARRQRDQDILDGKIKFEELGDDDFPF